MTSMREYALLQKAYNERQQIEWERSRWVAFSVFSPFVKNGPKSAEQWCRFPWERQVKKKIVSITEHTENVLNDIYADFIKRTKQ